MRRFIRHPSSMPIEFEVQGEDGIYSRQLANVSQGGVCFQSGKPLEAGMMLRLAIPVSGREFHAHGVVAWCRKEGDHFQIGVQFNDPDTAYTMRMVEQLCHIEDFRREASRTRKRRISRAQAAAEWISRYAEKFPH